MPGKPRVPTVQELFAFARSVEGDPLETLHRAKPFSVAVVGSDLQITPGSRKPRATTPARVAEVLEKLDKTGSYQPVQYQHLTFNASYVLALVKMWQET